MDTTEQYKYIASSGIWSTEAEGSVHNSTSKPPRLDYIHFKS